MSLSPVVQWFNRSNQIRSRGYSASIRRFSIYQQCRQSVADPSISTIAASLLSRFQSLGPQTRSQVLDGNQLQLLSLTLNRSSLYPNSPSLGGRSNTSTTSLPVGTALPPGYHLVYFTPAFLENDLGADGTDVSYNPEAPFTQRMWAGGEVYWPRAAGGNPNPLRVGQEVQETTQVLSVEPKIIRKTGEQMIVVRVGKEFRNEHGLAVVDRRSWIFREALAVQSVSSRASDLAPVPTAPAFASTFSTARTHTRTLRQTAVTLFRFSALTFNPHKIHYSTPWAQQMEGHRDIVVHGPLNLIAILDLWRDTRPTEGIDPAMLLPESIKYRATSPLYAEDEYQIVLDEEDGNGTGQIQILAPSGKVAMKAEVRSAM
ncbi:hypothetical protein BDV28DRAFT_67639 [Aspergillus coremiiformis]|uniref:HotDog domain-containing protein n=1 Tax=Aspergillus coremiiformis TaxID=138285 RepID=A0A5N6YUI8_9EURO|nr:hypothetical protein BDV28DRAFT_67639 [Aspergillus coremiiformis]